LAREARRATGRDLTKSCRARGAYELHRTSGRPPTKVGVPIADILAGMSGALASAGYIAHIKANPRRKGLAEGGDAEHPPNSIDESSKGIHPARRWMVERTISWLLKRRSLRTRCSKKAENWLALDQLACTHILLNLAVFGKSLSMNSLVRLWKE
jgi:transposase